MKKRKDEGCRWWAERPAHPNLDNQLFRPRSLSRPRRKDCQAQADSREGVGHGGGGSLMVLTPFRLTGAFFPAVPLPEPGCKSQGGEGEAALPRRDLVSCGGAGCRRRSAGQAMPW